MGSARARAGVRRGDRSSHRSPVLFRGGRELHSIHRVPYERRWHVVA
jgi:hypothetical protein